MGKSKEEKDISEMVDVKLIGHSTAVNIKYEGGIIEMKKNVIVSVPLDVYENILSKMKGYKIIKV